MKLRSFLLLIALLATYLFPASAAPVSHWFERANSFYEKGEFDSAAMYYEKIVSAGQNSSDVYYNLANTCFRLKKTGMALLYYEKAHKLMPYDQDISANLKYANLMTVDKMPAPERGFIGAIFVRLHTLLPLQTQLWVLFVLLMILAALFSMALFVSGNARLWIMYAISLLLAMNLALGVSVGLKIYKAETASYAIVLDPAVDVKSEPGGARILFTVHEGAKLQVVKELDKWSFVSLPNGSSGWVEGAVLGKI